MKIIILSDIHGNLEALQSALYLIDKLTDKHPDTHVYSLGDIVGYGANPRECIAHIKKIAEISLIGNHDHASLGLTDITYFNPYAMDAILWTKSILEEEDRGYLSALPFYREFSDRLYIVHSTPISPQNWRYIFSLEEAKRNFSGFAAPLCFIGHSHIPVVIEYGQEGILKRDIEKTIQLKAGNRYIINVGSVGQPRDGDWRACLAIYNEEDKTIEYKRLPYDLTTARNKILKAGLPAFLADRLSHGR